MPKPTKLHNKGKTSSIQKSMGVSKEIPSTSDPEDNARQYQLELCWCIQQLERLLTDKKENERKLQEAWKVLTVLKNNNQPIIRKRQLMRTYFGDYRAKMTAEEKKMPTMASKMKISDVSDQSKATFLRKSAFLMTGDNSFRFNFNLSPDQTDNAVGNSSAPCMDKNSETVDSDTVYKFRHSDTEFKFNFNHE